MSIVNFDAPETLESAAVVVSEIQSADVDAAAAGPEEMLAVATTDQDGQGAEAVAETEPSPIVEEHSGEIVPNFGEAEDEECEVRSDEEADLLDEILEASMECRKLEAVVELKKEEVKEAKSQLEQAVIRLRNVCSEIGTVRGMCRRRSTLKQSRQEVSQVVHQTVSDSSASGVAIAPETTSAADQPAESWRAVPMATILEEKIKGFGAKKKEALIDLCPTLGDFEELRRRVGKDAAELHELLPDGIGLETASVIEERHLDWIAKNYQESGVQSEATSICERARQINDGSNACLDARHHEGPNWHESGWTAYGKDCPLEECPYIPGPEQDDWIRGWLSHQLNDRQKIESTSSQDSVTPKESEEVSQVASMPVGLDDL